MLHKDLNVKIPLSCKDTYSICLDGKYGVFANLPYKDVKIFPGHACVFPVGLIKQMYALGVLIQYTIFLTAYCANSTSTYETVCHGIHGSLAMKDLVKDT